ncbi:type II toxin-antitoxin system RelB family antitoxin [Streptococcus sobrinus]|uniref:type II toxin-antitoxin system RelB family antitoxin n=1 Tax=Streptococcus sobrinus TaxID=1310 RepID=UPI0003024C63|nr:DUF6290 family protein [Streptococcus sobrinus]
MELKITITLDINDRDRELIKKYAKSHGLTVSEFARQAMLEQIEDEYDLQVLRQAMAEDDGERISFEDVMKEFGL